MKKLCFVAVVLLYCAQTNACDICGCSVSNYNPFLFPHLSKTFVGISYINRHYHIRNEDESLSKQAVSSFILSAKINAGKKIQLNVLVPFQKNTSSNGLINERLNGIGDISVTAGWKAWNRLTRNSRQTVMVGTGVKLPTGKHYPGNSKKLGDQVFNIGSGSVDYILYGTYKAGYRKWFYNLSGSYKYNTANRSGFRYGDNIDISLLAGKRIDIDKIALSPYLQAGWQKQMQNAVSHLLSPASGSDIIQLNIGADVNTRNLTAGLSFQVPAIQQIAGGQISIKPGIGAHIAYNF